MFTNNMTLTQTIPLYCCASTFKSATIHDIK